MTNERKGNCCACGCDLPETSLYFTIEEHEAAICGRCVSVMFPSHLPEGGIVVGWKEARGFNEKCMICEREIEPEEWKANHAGVNFIGAPIKIQGHAVCIGNVKKKIVIPNRDRFEEVRQVMERMGQILMKADLREAPAQGRA
jgi:hypothetical protein